MSARSVFKQVSVVAAVCAALAAPLAAQAASIGTVKADTSSLLIIDWTLDAGFVGNLSFSSALQNWGATLTFNQAADTTSVLANHIAAPHGEPPVAPGEYAYNGPIAQKLVFALPTGPLTVEVPVYNTKSFVHGGHGDTFTFFSTSSTHGMLIAQHVPEVPEPEAFALTLAGLGVVGAVMRRRRVD